MIGRRALEIFESFGKGPLAFDAKEIDELLKNQLVVEVDPRDLATLSGVEPALLEHVQVSIDDPTAPSAVMVKLAEVDEKLKSSWSRLTTRDSKVKAQEADRRALRRLLAVVNDRILIERLVATRAITRNAATPFLACTALGDELYALTAKGRRAHQQLALRADRFGDHPLAAFMKQFDKTETKMAAFGGDIAKLSGNIGYVKKNPHQVVIGLAKSGMPADQALGTYKASVKAVGAPDVAVTLTRNAGQGGTQAVAAKLRAGEAALYQCGFPRTPVVAGAAKTLLPYEPVEDGVRRFVELVNGIIGAGFTSERLDIAIKCAARLMPADGSPAEVVQRVTIAVGALRRLPSRVPQVDGALLATALGSMVREANAVEPLVQRFRQVEAELVRAQASHPNQACANALECVACPGTPVEVVDTVRSLSYQVAQQAGRANPTNADVAVAVAFAKRFAY